MAFSTKKPPVDADGRPLILKSGTIDCNLVETTPVVFKNKVYRFEYVRAGYWDNQNGDSYFRFVDHETGKPTKSFAKGFHLGSAFVHDDEVFVTAVDIWDGERIYIFASDDLENWESWLAFQLPGYGIFNTFLTRDENQYVLMFEIGKPEEEAGKRFTARFATSTDLKNWEASPLNPVLKASPEDKQIANKKLPEEILEKIADAEDINNSDIDFCEFNGKLIINYSWGNQRGKEFLAEAIYNGTLEQFLNGWFPDK